jgi:peptidoglycan/LPS O-acetylase OafA/YrhL
LFVIVVAGLAEARSSAAFETLDKALGEIAYPVFLLHWFAGFVAALVLMPGSWRVWSIFLMSMPITLVLAAALSILSHKLIDPLRVCIRRSAIVEHALFAAVSEPCDRGNRELGACTHQTSGRDELAVHVDRGLRVADRQCHELVAPRG